MVCLLLFVHFTSFVLSPIISLPHTVNRTFDRKGRDMLELHQRQHWSSLPFIPCSLPAGSEFCEFWFLTGWNLSEGQITVSLDWWVSRDSIWGASPNKSEDRETHQWVSPSCSSWIIKEPLLSRTTIWKKQKLMLYIESEIRFHFVKCYKMPKQLMSTSTNSWHPSSFNCVNNCVDYDWSKWLSWAMVMEPAGYLRDLVIIHSSSKAHHAFDCSVHCLDQLILKRVSMTRLNFK
jgi:hypothetical protein